LCLSFEENHQMKKSLLALAAVTAITAMPAVVQAQEASPLSFNVSLTSDYRYRGISQSRLKPALQGGVDYALPNGFYVGTWLSTIKWIKDAGGGADVEWDLYGGYKGELTKGLGFDVGVLSYQYPSHDLAVSPVTNEIYGALTFGPATLKYSHSVSNLFGFSNSKNSGYLDLSATFDVSGISVTPHVGYQTVKNNDTFSYTDYSLTASKDFSGFILSASLVGTDTKDYVGPNGKNLGKNGLVVAVKKTF
jgi:uncharacterized protein (TIGR02001 family)